MLWSLVLPDEKRQGVWFIVVSSLYVYLLKMRLSIDGDSIQIFKNSHKVWERVKQGAQNKFLNDVSRDGIIPF